MNRRDWFTPCLHVMTSGPGRGLVCGHPRRDPLHWPWAKCPDTGGCQDPLMHHPFKEEPMPDPTVTIGTVTVRADIEARPYVTIQFQPGDAIPGYGDRVAVAGSVDAIFGWMDALPAKRVMDAAREWADMADREIPGGPSVFPLPEQRALYEAVRAYRAPSGEPAVTGYDAGDPKGDRTARVFIVNVGPDDEWLLHTGDRLILSPAGDVSVVIAQEAR